MIVIIGTLSELKEAALLEVRNQNRVRGKSAGLGQCYESVSLTSVMGLC